MANGTNLAILAQNLNLCRLLSLLPFILSFTLKLLLLIPLLNLLLILCDEFLSRKIATFIRISGHHLCQIGYFLLVALHDLLAVLGLVLTDGLVHDQT